MIVLALFVVLADGLITVPPSDWKAVEVRISEHGTTLDCSFQVKDGGTRVGVLLMERADAERFRRGRAIHPLYLSGFEKSGRFRVRISEAGDYVLVVDNRIEGRTPTRVLLRLETTNPRNVNVRTLSLERRRAVVALSLLFFGTVILFSARQYFKHAQR